MTHFFTMQSRATQRFAVMTSFASQWGQIILYATSERLPLYCELLALYFLSICVLFYYFQKVFISIIFHFNNFVSIYKHEGKQGICHLPKLFVKFKCFYRLCLVFQKVSFQQIISFLLINMKEKGNMS